MHARARRLPPSRAEWRVPTDIGAGDGVGAPVDLKRSRSSRLKTRKPRPSSSSTISVSNRLGNDQKEPFNRVSKHSPKRPRRSAGMTVPI